MPDPEPSPVAPRSGDAIIGRAEKWYSFVEADELDRLRAVDDAVRFIEKRRLHATFYAMAQQWRVSTLGTDMAECAPTLPAAVAALKKRLEDEP